MGAYDIIQGSSGYMYVGNQGALAQISPDLHLTVIAGGFIAAKLLCISSFSFCIISKVVLTLPWNISR